MRMAWLPPAKPESCARWRSSVLISKEHYACSVALRSERSEALTFTFRILGPRDHPMRIDAHQHFWMYDSEEYEWIDDSMRAIRRDFLPTDLAPELARNGFAGSVAVQARQTLQETRWLLSLADQNPKIVGVVGWVDLCSPDVTSQLKEFSINPKFVGVRHVVQSEPDDRFLMRQDFMRGIAALEEFDLAYDVLIYEKHLSVAAEF